MLAAGSVSPTQAELQAADDLARHQEALSIVCAFAAKQRGHMQTCTSGQAVTHDPEVLQACCNIAGKLLTSTLCYEATLFLCPCLSHACSIALIFFHKSILLPGNTVGFMPNFAKGSLLPTVPTCHCAIQIGCHGGWLGYAKVLSHVQTKIGSQAKLLRLSWVGIHTYLTQKP